MVDREGRRLCFVRTIAKSVRSEVLEVERDGERLALKVMFAADEPDAGDAFEREVSSLAEARHPNLARVIDSGRAAGGLAWILMPFYEGVTLRARLRGNRTLSPRRACRLFRDYLDGLEALHRAGIAHRDLSPKNLFIGRDVAAGRTAHGLILDLGRAHLATRDDLVTGDQIVGTPGYLAPEQILGGAIDCRTDIFALGLCLFEALAGVPAFSGESAGELLQSGVPHLSEARSGGVFDILGSVIARATKIGPGDRYASAAEFREALVQAWAFAREEAA
jgi:eukaryotic-like serine/threonine-protein kinase